MRINKMIFSAVWIVIVCVITGNALIHFGDANRTPIAIAFIILGISFWTWLNCDSKKEIIKDADSKRN